MSSISLLLLQKFIIKVNLLRNVRTNRNEID